MLDRFGTTMSAFLVGVCVGLLLAPRSGRETRRLLRQTVSCPHCFPSESPEAREERRRAIEEEISVME